MDAVLATELAAGGFEGATDILDHPRGLSAAVIQDGSVALRLTGLGDGWELTRNAFKPYACCGLTHASIDCGRKLAPQLGARTPTRIRLEVHPLVTKVANRRDPATPLEGKFSLVYCAALALGGHHATEVDFCDERLRDERVRSLQSIVEIEPSDQLATSAAVMRVELEDGQSLQAETLASLGSPENPVGWDEMRDKFLPLVEPVLGAGAHSLFDTLREFEAPGSFARAMALASGQ